MTQKVFQERGLVDVAGTEKILAVRLDRLNSVWISFSGRVACSSLLQKLLHFWINEGEASKRILVH